MKRIAFLALAFGIVAFIFAGDVYAHGGSFRGPSGGVPPGLREPSDPEPPPPPPSDPGEPGGPTTPSEPAPGPTTPPDQGRDSPKDSPPPNPVQPTGPEKKKATTKSLTFESWRFWWGYNNDDILNLKSHIYSSRTSSSSPIFFSSKRDEQNRRNAQRPTERAVMKTIIPALMRSLNRPGDHEDIHGGCLVALGKIGTSTYVPLFSDAVNNKYKTEKGRDIKFGLQATESAALALGLLPNLDARGKDAVRRVCLEVIRNRDLRSRERVWTAVALGLQKDTEAVDALKEMLDPKYSYKQVDVPAGILAGLGLIGDDRVLDGIVKGLKEGDLFGRDIVNEDRIRAFCGYAITKIGNPRALPEILMVLKSRSFGRVIKRSAAIAAGVLGSKADPEMRDEAVKVLDKFIRQTAKDPSGENFAIIAMSQIGTKKAYKSLIKIAESGKYSQRPFAGLGLATQVFYKRRAAADKTGEPMDPDTENEIVQAIRKLSSKYKDSDTK
ncbi:MAG: HEAT repeat domain-containing protein, partial [Planctomycetota bacterium]